MKFEHDWLLKLFTDTDFITQLTALIRALTGIANLMIIVLSVYFSYQGIREVVSWFH